MNREIKFRAWNGEKMRYQTQALRKMSRFFHLLDIDVKEYILMQYTGLKDKNGKEIYEGDIIQYDNRDKAKVIFHFGSFTGYNGEAISSDEAYLSLSPEENPIDGHDFELEVIGNIYQNPELIK